MGDVWLHGKRVECLFLHLYLTVVHLCNIFTVTILAEHLCHIIVMVDQIKWIQWKIIYIKFHPRVWEPSKAGSSSGSKSWTLSCVILQFQNGRDTQPHSHATSYLLTPSPRIQQTCKWASIWWNAIGQNSQTSRLNGPHSDGRLTSPLLSVILGSGVLRCFGVVNLA